MGLKQSRQKIRGGDDLEEELNNLAIEASRLEKEVKDKQLECDVATAKVASLNDEVEQLKDDATDAARVTKEALANADQELEAAKISLENAQKGYAKVGVKRTKLMQAVVRDSRFISRLEKEMRDMTVENTMLQTQLQELQEVCLLSLPFYTPVVVYTFSHFYCLYHIILYRWILGPDMIQRFNEMNTRFTTDIPPCFDRAMEYIRLQHENRLDELSFPVYNGEGGIITQSSHLDINNDGQPVIYSKSASQYKTPGANMNRFIMEQLNIIHHLKRRIVMGYKRLEEELVNNGEQDEPVSWGWGRVCDSSHWSEDILRALLPLYLQLIKENGVTVDDVMNSKSYLINSLFIPNVTSLVSPYVYISYTK